MEEGDITGCEVTRNNIVSHFLFVDDVLCAGESKYGECTSFHIVLDNFGKGSSPLINRNKTKIF